MAEKLSLVHENKDIRNPLQLGVLTSNKGTGSNLRAIHTAISEARLKAQINLVISDRTNALGLEWAQEQNLRTQVLRLKDRQSVEARDEYSTNLAQTLNRNGIQVAVFAGFMTILNASYFEQFEGISINIHPGWVPDNPKVPPLFPDDTPALWNRGLMTDSAVKNFLDLPYAGSSVHIVTQQTDFGPVLNRMYVEVEQNDTVDSLYGRLKLEEHRGLIESLQHIESRRGHYFPNQIK